MPVMFVIKLTYEVPLEEIDRLMPRHVRFLESCFEAGAFIAAGRQVPRTGGIILARASSKHEVDEIMKLDPFVLEGAASFEITEFRTSFHARAFAPFADPRTRALKGPD